MWPRPTRLHLDTATGAGRRCQPIQVELRDPLGWARRTEELLPGVLAGDREQLREFHRECPRDYRRFVGTHRCLSRHVNTPPVR